jgi:hypothetical protein
VKLPRKFRAAAIASALGTPLALGGAVTALAKPNSEEAYLIALGGSLLNGTGGALRFSVFLRRARKLWATDNLWATVKGNLKSFAPRSKKVVAAPSLTSPLTSPVTANTIVSGDTRFHFTELATQRPRPSILPPNLQTTPVSGLTGIEARASLGSLRDSIRSGQSVNSTRL